MELIDKLLSHCHSSEQFAAHLREFFTTDAELSASLAHYIYQRHAREAKAPPAMADAMESIVSYSFINDETFTSGLAGLLSCTASLDDLEWTLARAKAFYFARKTGIPYSREHEEMLLRTLGFDDSLLPFVNSCPFAQKAMRGRMEERMASAPMFEACFARGKRELFGTTDHPLWSTSLQSDDRHLFLIIRPGMSPGLLGRLQPKVVVMEGQMDASVLGYLRGPGAQALCYCTDNAKIILASSEADADNHGGPAITLRAADVVKIGVCRGMVPVGKASRILRAAPFLFYAFGAETTVQMLKRLLDENMEYAGPSQLE